MKKIIVLVGLLVWASAQANEAQIRKALEPKLSGAKIEGVQPAPVSGLWEVRVRTDRGLRILYTDPAAAYVIDGSIHDLRTNRDLTEERLRKLNAIKFESLPLDLAVKVQRGNGKRVLAQTDDITIYVFMYPVIRPENADHSRAVWCSTDRAKAWLDLAAAPRPKVPEAPSSCANPVDKVLEIGQKLGVNSTPTLFFANGERMAGGLRPEDLKEMLDRVAAARQ